MNRRSKVFKENYQVNQILTVVLKQDILSNMQCQGNVYASH